MRSRGHQAQILGETDQRARGLFERSGKSQKRVVRLRGRIKVAGSGERGRQSGCFKLLVERGNDQREETGIAIGRTTDDVAANADVAQVLGILCRPRQIMAQARRDTAKIVFKTDVYGILEARAGELAQWRPFGAQPVEIGSKSFNFLRKAIEGGECGDMTAGRKQSAVE